MTKGKQILNFIVCALFLTSALFATSCSDTIEGDDYVDTDSDTDEEISFEFSVDGYLSMDTIMFYYGETKIIPITINDVSGTTLSEGSFDWVVSLDLGIETLTITAPEKEDYSGYATDIAITVTGLDYSAITYNFTLDVITSETRVLTFEDSDYVASANYLGESSWSSLIDIEYGGTLLYGESGWGPTEYCWYDENNTFLKHEFPSYYGSAVYWGGGHAISNYVENDISACDYDRQLSIAIENATTGNGGFDSSANFAVHYGYTYWLDEVPTLYFGDGEERVINHMYVMTTSYLLNCLVNGNGLSTPLGENSYLKVVATGYDIQGDVTGTEEIYLAQGGEILVNDWTKWDLSSLGKVLKVTFVVDGDDDNGAGFSQPAYFAYDNVSVEYEF